MNWPNGPREAGLDHAVPYESGIVDCQKHGAALCSRAGPPLRFNGGYVLILQSRRQGTCPLVPVSFLGVRVGYFRINRPRVLGVLSLCLWFFML